PNDRRFALVLPVTDARAVITRAASGALDERSDAAPVVRKPCRRRIGFEVLGDEDVGGIVVAHQTKRTTRRSELELRLEVGDAMQISLLHARVFIARLGASVALGEPALLIRRETVLLIARCCLRRRRIDID